MVINKLPPSERIACGSNIDEIGAALRKALEGSLSAGYGYMAPILGKNASGLAISPKPLGDDATKLSKPLTPTEMATHLVHIEKYRVHYRQIANPDKKIKGWEIRRATPDDGEPIVIALATWVPPYLPQMPSFI